MSFSSSPSERLLASTSSCSSWLLCTVLLLLLQFGAHRPCAVVAALQPTTLGVYIVRSPESAVAPKGDEVVFECELNLRLEQLKWRFRHADASATDANNFHYLEDGPNISNDERTSKLRVFVSNDTVGDYQCVAWFGSAAIASSSARLTLVSIAIDNSNGYTRSAIRWSVAPKNCILIRCGTVSSNPPAVWSFYRNGEKLPQTEVLPSNGGALILNSVSTKDSGNYTCTAMNAITGEELKVPQRIDVRVDYTDRTPPYFLLQPATNVTSRPGETLVLECPGVGSPPPEAVWSSPNVMNIYNNRTKMLPYGLQIADVLPEDQGSYVCRLDNGIAPALVHIIKFTVLERPKILRGPATTLTNEGDPLELECSAMGNPIPDIYWLINGEDTSVDNETFHEDRRLVIKRVQKRHAGIVQCFAKNEVGEISEGSLLQVNPKQIRGEAGSGPLGNVAVRPQHEHSGNKNKGKRKHTKAPNMIPPSRPNVTRLSDDSVMLRWYVPRNDGLPIQFFKVQYRMLGDNSRKIPRENWQTTNEDIPYGKRDRNFEGSGGGGGGVKNFTSSVSGLKPDRYYRFRIIAVYSNNDNKEGNTSVKFFLQRGGPSKASLPAPELVRVEPLTETVVLLHWTLPANPTNMADGFYAYYRPASSAGEYLKATVDGMQTRKFKIDMLEAGTAYEFKLQSFNALAASEFSAILQGKTKSTPTTPSPTAPSVIPTTKANEEDNSIYPVVAGAAGGGILLLLATIAACLCMKRRKNSQPEDENKPQLDHIQADFVSPSVLGVSSTHHKSGHRLNGVIPRMNITPNPLAQEADKNRNVMELRFMPNSNSKATTTTAATTTTTTTTPTTASDAAHTDADELQQQQQHQHQRSSSSCETLEASEGVSTATPTNNSAHCNGLNDPHSPLSKPLPPLPTKAAAGTFAAATATAAAKPNHTTPPQHGHAHNTHASSSFNLNNSQGSHLGAHQGGLHHAQPYQQTPGGTPTMLHKRMAVDYQSPPLHHNLQHPMHQQQQQHHQQQLHAHPPPVPPHQNNNNNNNNQAHHPYQQQQQHHPYQQPPPPLTPSMEQHRRTLERSARNLHYGGGAAPPTSSPPPPHDAAMNIDGLPTRIPSLRRTRRTSGNANNNNGGVGIPIVVPGSPRTGSGAVQRSPMPARAMMKRNRLGSHNNNDNMSSGSLNSIEV